MKTIDYSEEEKIAGVIDRGPPDLEDVNSKVGKIIEGIKRRGDFALCEYTQRFDSFDLTKENIRVTGEEINAAYKKVDPKLVEALVHASRNIKRFHCEQASRFRGEWHIEVQRGVTVGEKVRPIETVGCYVPGGRAPYPSSVLMTTIPARVAGCSRVIIVSPPPIPEAVLVAADICEIDEIYRVGGAQAIAALAYGTDSIPKVDKIVGPGNKYVTAAKMQVYGRVDIDMPAGPSEILILGDDDSDPGLIAADMLAQAEHDPNAQCVLATDSKKLIDAVGKEIKKQITEIRTKDVAEKSLENAVCVLTRNLEETIEFANRYAAEHLEIMTREPEVVLDSIENAGAIFLGEYATVAVGDYASGGNHVLPTSGAARFSSQLNVRDFMKTSSVQRITKEGLSVLGETIVRIAGVEGFDAHKKSVEKRYK